MSAPPGKVEKMRDKWGKAEGEERSNTAAGNDMINLRDLKGVKNKKERGMEQGDKN